MKNDTNCLKTVSWQDIRDKLRKINLKLTFIIDEVPDDNLALYHLTSPYGCDLLDNLSDQEKQKLGLHEKSDFACVVLDGRVEISTIPRNPDPAIDHIVLSSGALFNLHSLLEDALFRFPMKSHWHLLSGVQSVSPQSEILFFPKSCFYRY